MQAKRLVVWTFVVLLLVGGALARARLVHGWVYAGSDSYAYLKLGDELFTHHRFALDADHPLEWYRRPLYPIFLKLLRRGHPATDNGGSGWAWITGGQIACDLLGALALFLLARRLAGLVAGFVALALALFYPISFILCGVALTEDLGMALTVLSIAPLLWLDRRPRLMATLSAAGIGLSTLLRPDGPLLAIGWLPALALLPTWRARVRTAALGAGVFVLTFGAWPLRNLVDFGRAHLADGMVDREGNDVPHYRGFWAWLRTWSRDSTDAEYPQSCFYRKTCKRLSPYLFERAGAFEDPGTADEKERVRALLEKRKSDGLTLDVSNAFLELARARRRAHPWRVQLVTPARRAWAMWTEPPSDPIRSERSRPWRRLLDRVEPSFGRLARWLLYATVAGLLLLCAWRRTRIAGLVLLAVILSRTVVLAWIAFALPRYIAPIYPLCFVAIAGAAGALVALATSALSIAIRRLRKRSSPA